jgi:hypothetical protein
MLVVSSAACAAACAALLGLDDVSYQGTDAATGTDGPDVADAANVDAEGGNADARARRCSTLDLDSGAQIQTFRSYKAILDLAADDFGVYVVDLNDQSTTFQVTFCPIGATCGVTAASWSEPPLQDDAGAGEALAVAAGGDYVFWAEGRPGRSWLRKRPRDGGDDASDLVVQSTNVSVADIATASVPDGGTFVFWIAKDSSYLFGCRVGQCSGGNAFGLTSKAPVSAPVSDGVSVFWPLFTDGGDAGEIARCAISGCAGAPEIVASTAGSARLALAGDRLVWADERGDINTCSRTSCQDAAALARASGTVSGLTADDCWVVWAEESEAGTSSIARCPIEDCDAGRSILATEDASVRLLTMGHGRLYWSAGRAIRYLGR